MLAHPCAQNSRPRFGALCRHNTVARRRPCSDECWTGRGPSSSSPCPSGWNKTFGRAGCRSRHSWERPGTKRGHRSPCARGVNGQFRQSTAEDGRPSEPPTLCGPCGGGDRPVAVEVKASHAASGRPTPRSSIIIPGERQLGQLHQQRELSSVAALGACGVMERSARWSRSETPNSP